MNIYYFFWGGGGVVKLKIRNQKKMFLSKMHLKEYCMVSRWVGVSNTAKSWITVSLGTRLTKKNEKKVRNNDSFKTSLLKKPWKINEICHFISASVQICTLYSDYTLSTNTLHVPVHILTISSLYTVQSWATYTAKLLTKLWYSKIFIKINIFL